jgi:hypothetical protein
MGFQLEQETNGLGAFWPLKSECAFQTEGDDETGIRATASWPTLLPPDFHCLTKSAWESLPTYSLVKGRSLFVDLIRTI